MDQLDLKSLRPTEQTVAGVTASLAAIDTAIATREALVAPLEERRAAALLTATTKEILAIEAEQAAVRVDLDRLRAVRAVVAADLPAAQQREALAALQAVRTTAVDAVAVYDAEMRAYPELIAHLGRLREVERAMVDAVSNFRRAAEAATGSQGGRTWAGAVALAFGPDSDAEALRAPSSELVLAQGHALAHLSSLPALPALMTRAAFAEATAPRPIQMARPLTAEEIAERPKRGIEIRQPGGAWRNQAPASEAEGVSALHPHNNRAA